MPRFDPDTYESVEERLQRFWAEHPEGRIFTQLISSADVLDQTVVRAEVYFDHTDQFPRGTGLAFETRGGSGANATSHLENCETSAIGRALANCNYKARRDSARPSQEEMRKVQGAGIGREPAQAERFANPSGPMLTGRSVPPAQAESSGDRGALLPNGSPREQVASGAFDTSPPEGAKAQPGVLSCSEPECGKVLTRGQHDVSLRAFGQPLCPEHQKLRREVAQR